jgi:hypothetical protein
MEAHGRDAEEENRRRGEDRRLGDAEATGGGEDRGEKDGISRGVRDGGRSRNDDEPVTGDEAPGHGLVEVAVVAALGDREVGGQEETESGRNGDPDQEREPPVGRPTTATPRGTTRGACLRPATAVVFTTSVPGRRPRFRSRTVSVWSGVHASGVVSAGENVTVRPTWLAFCGASWVSAVRTATPDAPGATRRVTPAAEQASRGSFWFRHQATRNPHWPGVGS